MRARVWGWQCFDNQHLSPDVKLMEVCAPRLNSAFTSGNPSAPEGGQVAFLQDAGATISQAMNGFQSGVVYKVTVSAAQRGHTIGNGGQDFEVFIDETSLGRFRPASTSYADFTTASFSVTAGTHTLKFVGLNTAFIDKVRLSISSDPLGTNFPMARLESKNRTGQPGVDLLSGNYHWSVPIVSLPGRAGLDLGLALSYNSLVWTRDSSSIKFNADNGFPTPGFRLGFPVVQSRFYNSQTGKNAYLLITPSGQGVELPQVGAGNVYEAADSSYLQLIDYGGVLLLRTTDGTQLTMSALGSEYHCTQVKDRNGNYISINYEGGRLKTIIDTLGRTITINYDPNSKPLSITQQQTRNGQPVTHQWATFGYGNLAIQTDFPGVALTGVQNGQTIPVLTQIGLADGALHSFEYTSWGQVHKISTSANNELLNYTAYNLPGSPLMGSSAQDDGPRFTERRDWARYWNGDGDGIAAANEEAVTSYSFAADQSSGQATLPNGTVHKEFFATGGWQNGLTMQTEVWAGGVRTKWSTNAWTQDDINLTYQKNPRPVDINVYDAENNRRRTTIGYTTVGSISLPSEYYEYANDGATQIRWTHDDYYWREAYLNQHIIGLKYMRHVHDGNGVLEAKTEYHYDYGGEYLQNPGAMTQHDPNYSTGFAEGRGNLSLVLRFDAGYRNDVSRAVQHTIGYTIAGAPIFTRDGLGHQTTISYADSFADGINRNTLAYPTTATDPDNYSSTMQYDYDWGVVTRTQDPKGAAQAMSYDGAGRAERITNLVNGAYTRWTHPANLAHREQFTTRQEGPGEDYSVDFLDGAGRVRAKSGYHDGSAGQWRAQFIQHDVMGRATAQTNMTEIDAGWIPAGDDAVGWVWSQQFSVRL